MKYLCYLFVYNEQFTLKFCLLLLMARNETKTSFDYNHVVIIFEFFEEILKILTIFR